MGFMFFSCVLMLVGGKGVFVGLVGVVWRLLMVKVSSSMVRDFFIGVFFCFMWERLLF